MILRLRGAKASGTSPSSFTTSFIALLQELHVAGETEETLAAVERDRLAGKGRRCNDEAQGRDDLLDSHSAAERVHRVDGVEIVPALKPRDEGHGRRDPAHPDPLAPVMAGEQLAHSGESELGYGVAEEIGIRR